jgi:thiosulfate/3-mercaptopyruvate sulfurtransferase
MHPLITPAELAERLGSPTLRLFDCTTFLHPQPGTHRMRVETGQRGYDEGHIPGAALIDLQADLSDPANSLRFTAPAPDDLARRFQALGVGDDTEVVLYSASDAWWATRVWWLLRAIGMDRAAVLDGGLRAWVDEGRPLSREPVRHPPAARLGPRPRPVFTDRHGVQAAIDQGSAVVVNCLRAEQHSGAAALHYGRPGHITGSINLPAAALFDAAGRYLPPAALREVFAARGIDARLPVIAYCGGGIAATGDAFALTALLGHEAVQVYDNSLQEWAADPALPMSVG